MWSTGNAGGMNSEAPSAPAPSAPAPSAPASFAPSAPEPPQFRAPAVYTAPTTEPPAAYHIAPADDDSAGMFSTENPGGMSEGGMMEGAAGGFDVERGQEVKDFLNGIEPFYVDQYFQLLVDNGFDTMELLSTLSDEDLEKVGVSMMGHRRKILMECKHGVAGTDTLSLL